MASRRGQAAVEYLIILAVVIIIALVVVGVLGGFPSLTRGVNEKESALYWQGSEIAIQKYFFASAVPLTTTNSSISLRNNKNFDIRFSLPYGIQMTKGDGTFTAVPLNCKTVSDCSGNTTVTMSPGDSKNLVIAYPNWVTDFCNSKGDTFSRKVTFNYTDTEGNYYIFVGTVPLVTTCQ
ncbi:MAG: hypothetical protein NTY90_01680 [Candidatus Micrarchaeota archaeon]|nr:hypothetical protein [Candidatus Micrarchaeota archaeon]